MFAKLQRARLGKPLGSMHARSLSLARSFSCSLLRVCSLKQSPHLNTPSSSRGGLDEAIPFPLAQGKSAVDLFPRLLMQLFQSRGAEHATHEGTLHLSKNSTAMVVRSHILRSKPQKGDLHEDEQMGANHMNLPRRGVQ